MRGKKFSIGLRASLAIFAVTLFVNSTRAAAQEKVLYSFCSQTNCTDGAGPSGGLISDAAGNLHGTTSSGGTYDDGTVFELTPAAGGGWTENVLHNFGNGTDGANPWASLIFDSAGNLYGTTVRWRRLTVAGAVAMRRRIRLRDRVRIGAQPSRRGRGLDGDSDV